MELSKQEVKQHRENTINLRLAVYSLQEKKILIAGLTGFITILALIYSLTFPTTYKASVLFTSAPSNSITNINRLIYIDETKKSIFTSFLSLLSSREIQKNIFIENDFITIFNKENNSIEDIDLFISEIIDSVEVIVPELNESEMKIYLNEKPYLISMYGSDEKALLDYLNLLVNKANQRNFTEILNHNNQKVSIRLDEIDKEIAMLIQDGETARRDEIEKLKEYLFIADSLEVTENNFNLIQLADERISAGNGPYNKVPNWYYYGEKALRLEIDLLSKRLNNSPFIPELIPLNREKYILESTIDSIAFSSSISIVDSTKTQNISKSKRLTVLLAFFVSLMLSILLALIMSVFNFDKKASSY
jgi:LPS O-antigen subunit length determinant protein (WzzB/FepE family)